VVVGRQAKFSNSTKITMAAGGDGVKKLPAVLVGSRKRQKRYGPTKAYSGRNKLYSEKFILGRETGDQSGKTDGRK